MKRHRGQVIAASLVVLALLSGMAGTTLGLFEARRQKARADERAEGELLATRKALEAAEEEKKAKETAEAVLGFVENKVFAAARPKGQEGGLGYDVKLADAVTAALPSIEKGFRRQAADRSPPPQDDRTFLFLPGQAGDRGGAVRGGPVAL